MGRLAFLLIFGLTGCAILVSLGNWQVRRLAWKEAALLEIETRIAADPVALPDNLDPERDKYLPVQISGEFGTDEIHVLVSVKHKGPGYRIIAPLRTDAGRDIMIDRGFVATPDKEAPRAPGPMAITGNLHWPDEIDSYTPAADVDGNIWFARDVAAMASHLGTEPVLLIARSSTDPGAMPLPVDTAGIPNDHLQYAVTWYGLATVWAAMTLYFLWRTRARGRSDET